MNYQMIHVEKADGIAVVTLENPPVNTIREETLHELNHAFTVDFPEDNDIKVIIITAAGDVSFGSGADVPTGMYRKTVEEIRNFVYLGVRTYNAIENIEKPVIAVPFGATYGGGFELAMVADFRFGTADSTYSFPEVACGATPGWGGTQRLPRLIGASRAKQIIMAGEALTAADALAWGVLNKVFDTKEEALSAAKGYAKQLMAFPSFPQGIAKSDINYGLRTDITAGIKNESEGFVMTCSTAETQKILEDYMASLAAMSEEA